MNESDALTAVSQNLKEETYKNFKIDKEIEVIHNFVDVKRFHRQPVDAFQKTNLAKWMKKSSCMLPISEK